MEEKQIHTGEERKEEVIRKRSSGKKVDGLYKEKKGIEGEEVGKGKCDGKDYLGD